MGLFSSSAGSASSSGAQGTSKKGGSNQGRPSSLDEEKELTTLEPEVRGIKGDASSLHHWWQRLSPTILAFAAIVLFLLYRSMTLDPTNKKQYLMYMGLLIVILYLLSQTAPTGREDRGLVTPEEAEWLTERAIIRKVRWGQFPLATNYVSGPVSSLLRRDGGGVYYHVGVTLYPPQDAPQNFISTVMAKGEARGFTTLQESIGPISGRELINEKSLIPPIFKDAERVPILEKVLFYDRKQQYPQNQSARR